MTFFNLSNSKTELIKILKADLDLRKNVKTFETSFSNPVGTQSRTGAKISILNGDIIYEGDAIHVSIMVAIRTVLPNIVKSDELNDKIVQRVIEVLTGTQDARRLNNTVSALTGYNIEPYEDDENPEIRSLIVTMHYKVYSR